MIKESSHNHRTVLSTERDRLTNSFNKRNRGSDDHTDMGRICPHQGLMSTGRCLQLVIGRGRGRRSVQQRWVLPSCNAVLRGLQITRDQGYRIGSHRGSLLTATTIASCASSSSIASTLRRRGSRSLAVWVKCGDRVVGKYLCILVLYQSRECQ